MPACTRIFKSSIPEESIYLLTERVSRYINVSVKFFRQLVRLACGENGSVYIAMADGLLPSRSKEWHVQKDKFTFYFPVGLWIPQGRSYTARHVTLPKLLSSNM